MSILITYLIVNATIFIVFNLISNDVSFFFRWYDLWIGLYIDADKKIVYHLPVPMLGIRYEMGKEKR